MLLRFRKFLDGGAMAPSDDQQYAAPEQGGAPEEQSVPQGQPGGDPMQLILEAAVYAVLKLDCKTALEVCQVLVQLAQQGAQGGQEAPELNAPVEGEPVYRRGGKLIRRIRY